MHAVVLAGGLGTRLRPYTYAIPKPLMPLGDRPVLDILLRRLKASGATSATLCLGYLAPLINAFVGSGEQWGLDISCVVEDEPLGTAGPLRLVPALPSDFIVVNGDTLTDLDFRELCDAHTRAGAWATVFTPEVENIVDYGIIELDVTSGAIVNYLEKPRRTYHVSSGIYVLSKRLIDYIPAGRRFDMPDLIRCVLTNGGLAQSFRNNAYWRDIGRHDHFEAANRDFQADPSRFLVQTTGV
ncbi:MAG: nucleotidyltransferase family protein [Xanthobacteraceae bacterium]